MSECRFAAWEAGNAAFFMHSPVQRNYAAETAHGARGEQGKVFPTRFMCRLVQESLPRVFERFERRSVMTKLQKKTVILCAAICAAFAAAPAANAMHIMEGYLSPLFCIAWGVVCLPFFVKGLYEMKKVFAEM